MYRLILVDQSADNGRMSMINNIQNISKSPWYWLSYIIGGIALLAVALFYQHVLEELPCVVCIQIRLWIALLVIVAMIGFAVRKSHWPNIIMQLSMGFVSVGFIERSYLLLGTEKGFIFGGCGFDMGLPVWFKIEEWLPWIFKVETSCGYTPELILGITMAESLMFLSISLMVVSIVVAIATLLNRNR